MAGLLGRVSSKNEAAVPSQPRDFEIILEVPSFLPHSGFARVAVNSRLVCRDAGATFSQPSMFLNFVRRPLGLGARPVELSIPDILLQAACFLSHSVYNGVGLVKHNLATRLRPRAGAGSRAVRRFCSWPDRSSQTLDAAPARPTIGVDKALGSFFQGFVLEDLFRLSRPRLASLNPAVERLPTSHLFGEVFTQP